MKLLSQMTEKELKTLSKSLEERYGKNSTITLKQSDFNNMWASIDRYAKENKCLQEQLKSANNAMKAMLPFARNYPKERIEKYLKKWGVK